MLRLIKSLDFLRFSADIFETLDPETAAAHTNQGMKIKTRPRNRNRVKNEQNIYIHRQESGEKSSANARTAFVAGFCCGPRTLQVDMAVG